ncbi:unnamed protein product, partial [Effrenium voratum]
PHSWAFGGFTGVRPHGFVGESFRLEMINFLWKGGAAPARTRRSCTDSEAQHDLAALCEDLQGRPLVEEFLPVLQALDQALQIWAVPEAAFQAARAAVSFLKPYAQTERTLEFLLSTHTKKELAETCVTAVRRGISACQSAGIIEEKQELKRRWQKAVEGLQRKCQE